MGKKQEVRTYTTEYKVEAVKLARELGTKRAASELGIPCGTLGGWVSGAKSGRIDTGKGTQTPESALTQAEIVQRQTAEIKALKKENARLKEENEFLEEAASFFAASRRKSEKKNGSSS
jgi:transposase